MSIKNSAVLLGLLFFAIPAYAEQTAFGRDGVQSALLSPDGKYIALLNRSGDVDQFVIINTTQKNTELSRRTVAPQRIQSVAWVDNNSVALQLGEQVKYQLNPQATGEIEILEVGGESLQIGVANNGGSAIQKALAGRKLTVSAGLPSIEGSLLVNDQANRNLWRVDLSSDSIEAMDHPPFRLSRIAASPNAKYMAATGVADDGTPQNMVFAAGDEQKWQPVSGHAEFVAVNNDGIAFAIMDDESGVAGLAAISINDGSTRLLYQNEVDDVDQVMVDGSNTPFATRHASGFPSWNYLGAAQRLTSLHKSFRSAWPDSDTSFVSASADSGLVIAKRSDSDFPSSYFLVNANLGSADRLLDSKSGLSMIGGSEDDTYKLQSINVASESGTQLTGFIAVPQAEPDQTRPLVVLLRDKNDATRWQWGFDEETWFFQKQGFNVLMLNRNSAPSDLSTDIREAINWAVKQKLADEDRLCFFGRGTGAELALVTALENKDFDCVISHGGTFENPQLLKQAAEINKRKNRRLQVLFIYGADEDADQLLPQLSVSESLAALDIAVESMPIEGEQRIFSSMQSEVRAFAKISSFLGEHLNRKHAWPTLPLTYEQALAMNALHEALSVKLDEGISNSRGWRKWFDENDQAARNSLFDEQLALYESYQSEIIAMTEGKIGFDYVRFQPIRQNSGTRAAGRPGAE